MIREMKMSSIFKVISGLHLWDVFISTLYKSRFAKIKKYSYENEETKLY